MNKENKYYCYNCKEKGLILTKGTDIFSCKCGSSVFYKTLVSRALTKIMKLENELDKQKHLIRYKKELADRDLIRYFIRYKAI
jgi:Zn-finger protein